MDRSTGTAASEATQAAEQPPHRLDPLLRPRSIAFVGASARAGSVGNVMIRQALHGGFDGAMYAVNPRYDSVEGLPCHPSLADLPAPVEHVVLALADEHLEAAFDAALERGARAVTLFSSLVPARDGTPSLRERIRRKAQAAGVLLCGGMSMGFYNFARGLWVCGFETRPDHRAGGVALLTQSGSALAALVDADARLDFSLVVSSGLEQNTTTADYLDFALEMPSTTVVGLFLESVRDPRGFVAALAKAGRRGIPVVALKLGRSARGARMAESHSGAMVGNDGVFEALFDRYGVLRVRTLDELAATLMMFAQPRPVGPGGLVTIHDSGGERGLLVDLAADEGVPFAAISPATVARIGQRLDPGLPAENPLDAWGTGRDYLGVFRDCLNALVEDPAAALGAVVCDRGPGGRIYPEYPGFVREAAARSGKPVFLVSNHQGSGFAEEAVSLTREGLPVLDGVLPFLRGVRHLFEYRDFRARAPQPPPAAGEALVERWRSRLRRTRPDEAASMELLSDFGCPVNRFVVAEDLEGVLAAAERLGYPVVLKSARPGLRHKSEHGGVRLNLDDNAALSRAYGQLSANLGPRVLVAPMVRGGVEMILGMANDSQFGPVVMIGAGGIHAEIFGDVAFALPPFDVAAARRLLGRLAARRLLEGVRGAPAAHVEAVCEAAARFSALAAALGPDLDSIDVNPLIAGPDGCLAADALVVPRSTDRARSPIESDPIPDDE